MTINKSITDLILLREIRDDDQEADPNKPNKMSLSLPNFWTESSLRHRSHCLKVIPLRENVEVL